MTAKETAALTRTIDDVCIDTIRTLSIDAVEKAASGHPGMPMGAASMAYVLWDGASRRRGAVRWGTVGT